MSTTERTLHKIRRRVFLVDDHPLVREWLANVINQEPDLIVCGQTEGKAGCLEAVEKKRPDVVIVDLSLKDGSGLDLIEDLKCQDPGLEIIVLSMHDAAIYAQRAIRAGATGYVVKRETTKKFCKAISSVLSGVPYISDQLGSGLQEKMTISAISGGEEEIALLSDRELEVFRLLGMGESTRHISEALQISIKTVQVHCGNIREKLGLDSGTELLSWAVRWNERNGGAPL